MMNIFVTSDTHGNLERVLRMYDALTGDTPSGFPHIERFDMLVHAGDLKPDAFDLKNELGLDTVCVFGNCDGVNERIIAGHDFETFETPSGKVLVTHGDLEDVNTDHTRLLYLADQEGANCVIYGHTHVPVFDVEDDIQVVNPGSPSRPLDGSRYGSCAILTADENGYSGSVIYYEDMFPDASESDGGSDSSPEPNCAKPSKQKKTGGFLRKILNYADGQ